MVTVGLIWAQTPAGVIGQAGQIPWHIPEDLARFRAVTLGHPVVMGRRTWESLPVRPLPERPNLVLSRRAGLTLPGAQVAGSVSGALAAATAYPGPVWVIGGAEVYTATMDRASTAAVTEVDLAVSGDRFAPDLTGWTRTDTGPWQISRAGPRFRFLRYSR